MVRPTARSHRRYAVTALVTAAALILPAGLPAAASADELVTRKLVSSQPIDSELFREQAPLVAAADTLQELVARDRLSGFTGAAIDVEEQSVTLYWRGDPPASVADQVAQLRQRIRVTVVQVPYSEAELLAESRRIAEANRATVTEVGPTQDFTGLQVALNRTVDTTGVAAAIRGSTALPTTFTSGGQHEFAVHRWDDASPFWGGSAIDHLVDPLFRDYAYCTTGFAARRISTGEEALITAQHCGTDWDWRTPIGDRFVGHTANGSAALDATFLTGGNYDNAIYVGGPTSSTGRLVVGAGNPAQNSFVFGSGSWSGVAGVLEVTHINRTINIDGQTVGPGFWTVDISGLGSLGNGDSGGPVAQPSADQVTLLARGMIDILDLNSEVPCVNMPADGRHCGWRTFHTNIGQIATTLRLSIQTGP